MSQSLPVSVLSERRSLSGVVWAIRLLALAAFAVAGYLAWQSVAGRGPAGCGAGSDCDEVLSSRWSMWLGVPISAAAAAIYLAIIFASLGAMPHKLAARQRRSWGLLAALGVVAGGSALWFIGLQAGPMHRFCPYCMGVHVCGLLVALLVVVGLLMQTSETRPAGLWALFVAGACGPALLIAGQLLFPTSRALLTYGGSGSGGHASSQPATAGSLPRFWIGGEGVELDPRQLPVLGAPNAPYLLAIMTDYSCPHCRALHAVLGRVRQRYGEQLGLILLPVPMSGKCNPRILVTQPRHVNACELARLSLALWRADPAAYPKLDQWLFESATARTPAEVRAYAVQLVGAEALQRAEADPWIEQTIRQGVGLYAKSGGGLIPKLLLPKNVAPGEIHNDQDLFRLLERELGIRPAGQR
jgi:uncharacterized membrane protein